MCGNLFAPALVALRMATLQVASGSPHQTKMCSELEQRASVGGQVLDKKYWEGFDFKTWR